jgi:hypothetical protein
MLPQHTILLLIIQATRLWRIYRNIDDVEDLNPQDIYRRLPCIVKLDLFVLEVNLGQMLPYVVAEVLSFVQIHCLPQASCYMPPPVLFWVE